MLSQMTYTRRGISWHFVGMFSTVLLLSVAVGVYIGGAYHERLLSKVNYTASPSQLPPLAISNEETEEIIPSKPEVSLPASTPPQEVYSGDSYMAYITAYTYWDNTPPGSSAISNPVIHSEAGGTGTYIDPITLAVGHSITPEAHTLDYEPGTRFYLPHLKKYFIVEDTCGDGDTPQHVPCHIGFEGSPWLDIWIDGKDGTRGDTDACAAAITGLYPAIKNPTDNYPVIAGPVYSSRGCARVHREERL